MHSSSLRASSNRETTPGVPLRNRSRESRLPASNRKSICQVPEAQPPPNADSLEITIPKEPAFHRRAIAETRALAVLPMDNRPRCGSWEERSRGRRRAALAHKPEPCYYGGPEDGSAPVNRPQHKGHVIRPGRSPAPWLDAWIASLAANLRRPGYLVIRQLVSHAMHSFRRALISRNDA
jgi:hypothetical protein